MITNYTYVAHNHPWSSVWLTVQMTTIITIYNRTCWKTKPILLCPLFCVNVLNFTPTRPTGTPAFHLPWIPAEKTPGYLLCVSPDYE